MKLKQMLMDGDPPFLPDEIITNILKRLPVKTLIRFQCVSKHWKNLIKTPSFVRDHLHHQNPNLLIEQTLKDRPLHLSLFNEKMQFREFENAPIWMNSKLRIVGSCNGLLCLSDYTTIPPATLLWNPATREVRQIPSSASHYFPIPICWNFGFGFCPVINDYKIVRFSQSYMIDQAEVYSLSAGSWKNIYSENLKGVGLFRHGVAINGVMIWYGSILGLDIKGTGDSDVIISLDLATEVFTVTPSPASLSDSLVKLVVYEDKLAIISYSFYRGPTYTCTYFGVMEEGGAGSSGKGWVFSEKYIFNLEPLILCAQTSWRDQIVYIDYKRPILKSKCGLYLINVITNEHKRFAIPAGPGDGYEFYARVYNYVESLVQIGNMEH